MATGIPSTAKYSNTLKTSFRLEYDGKLPRATILKTAPANLQCVLSVTNQPQNYLIYGENLRVLSALLTDATIAGNVRLIYIDPPYATGSKFAARNQTHAYHDVINGAAYLEFMRQRLILLRELLADDGSIYLHLDENMAFPGKILMDEIFGEKNFRNWITRKKCNPKNYTRRQYGNISDYILFYTKCDRYVWNQSFAAWTEVTAQKEYQYIEPESGRRYKKVPIHAPGVRKGATGQPWRGMLPPPGKHWQYPPEVLEAMDAKGEIYWSATGNPRRKVYFEQSKGIPVQDIWLEFKDAHNQNIRVTGYPTEKNPDLLRRIILASSNANDLVLDAFVGSGTTLAVAEELGRQWIGIDNSPLAITTTLDRLAYGTTTMGDFVKGNSARLKQHSPIKSNPKLASSGLDLLIEIAVDLPSIPKTLIAEWQVKFKSIADQSAL
jgi:adenine-specific DNA-methyltransferase